MRTVPERWLDAHRFGTNHGSARGANSAFRGVGHFRLSWRAPPPYPLARMWKGRSEAG
jgi:hypothetical protein